MVNYLPHGSRPLPAQVAAQALGGLDDRALATLLAARPDLAEPPPSSLAELADRAERWDSVLACFGGMDLAAQQVLQAFSLLPAPTQVEELAELLGPGVTPAQLEPVLDRLAALALVVRDGGLRVVEVGHEVAHPAGLGPPMARLTGALPAADLQSIARHVGVDRHQSKSRLETAVRGALARPGQVDALLADAPAEMVQLAAMLAAGPPSAYLPYYEPRREDNPVEWLRLRGLVMAEGWQTITMPREVAIAIRGGRIFPNLALARPPLEFRPVSLDSGASVAVEHARRLVSDVVSLVDELEQKPVALLKSGAVGIRDVRRVATLLGGAEPDAARVIELAAAARLLGRDKDLADKGRLLPASGYDDWCTGDTAARWAALAAAWLHLPHDLSLAGALDDNGKATPPLLDHPADPHAPRLRRLVLETMAEAAPGTAVTDQTLAGALEWAAPLSWIEGANDVDDLVGELVLLGLAADGALTDLGRGLLEGPAHAQDALRRLLPPASREFVLQADFTAIASAELAPEVRGELALMADLESSGAATVYRFSPASLRRAFDAGRDGAALLAFLENHATRGVPQPLAYLLGDLGRRFGQLRLRSVACYIRSEDIALLEQVSRTRALASLGLSLIAPTVLTAGAPESTVLAALRAEGYLPAIEGPDGQTLVLPPGRDRAPGTLPASGATGPHLVELAARLRKGDSEPAGRSLTLLRGLGGFDASRDDVEGPPRPKARVSKPVQVRSLLEQAVDEEWAVGIRTGGKELIVLPDAVADGWFDGENALTGGLVHLAVAQVTSARVLGQAEEDVVLFG